VLHKLLSLELSDMIGFIKVLLGVIGIFLVGQLGWIGVGIVLAVAAAVCFLRRPLQPAPVKVRVRR